MGDFVRQQARGAKKAEKNMTPMQRLQREYEGLTKAAKLKEMRKGKESKYFSVIKKDWQRICFKEDQVKV